MQRGLILVIDDDEAVRSSTGRLLKRVGYAVETFESGDSFLAASLPAEITCVLLDVRMPGTDGIGVLRALTARGRQIPAIVISGHGDVPLAVEAMRLGAFDFLEKPFSPDGLFESIDRVISERPDALAVHGKDPAAEAAVEALSWRQRQVLLGILCGHPNKIIAYELGLSIRTVEAYRSQLLMRLSVRGTADAVKLALAAGLDASEFGETRNAAAVQVQGQGLS